MANFKNTREVIMHARQYIRGEVLDFGAGNAKYRVLIEPQASHYTTFDMIEGEQIDIVGDVLNAPFKNESFDTIISTQVLEHVEKPWIMAKEIGRIIRPGGVCIVTAPFMQPYHADPHDYFRYTRPGLQSLFTHEGFEVVETGTYGKAFAVFSDMINFSLFSRYSTNGRTKWKNRIANIVEKTAAKLDSWIKPGIVYSNVYVIMRKQ